MKRDARTSAHKGWERPQFHVKDIAYGELAFESPVSEFMLRRDHDVALITHGRHWNDQRTEVDNELTTGISHHRPGITAALIESLSCEYIRSSTTW